VFMHEYAEPIFLIFFAICALLNAFLFNLGKVRDYFEDLSYRRRNK
jgi:hypothetical protein